MRKSLVGLFSLLFVAPCFADIYIPPGGGGGSGSITIPQTVGGSAVSGGVACFTSATTLNSSALLASGSLLTGGGAGACPTGTTPGLNVLTTLQAAVNAVNGIISPTPTRAGDVVYWNGSNWVTLAGNNSGTVFLSESSAGVPSWAANSSSITFTTSCPPTTQTASTINLSNGSNVLAKSTAYTATTAECGSVYEVTGTTTITMPTIASGLEYTVINANPFGGAIVTVAADATHTIGNNAATSITLSPGESVGIAAGSGGTPTNWDLGPGLASHGLTGPGYNTTNFYFDRSTVSQSAGTIAPALLTAYCLPLWINNVSPAGGGTMTLGSLSFDVTTVFASGNVQLALYSNGSNNRPNTLLGSTGNLSTTSTGWQTGTISVSGVVQGQDWVCAQTDNTTVRWTIANVPAGQMANVGVASLANINTNTAGGVSTTTGITAFGTWPSFAAATWSNTSVIAPLVAIQPTSIP